MTFKKKWYETREELETLKILLTLAKLGALNKYVTLSTRNLAKILGFSQQSSSRKLKKLAEEGYISRSVSPRGEEVRITKKGLNLITKYHEELSNILKAVSLGTVMLRGIVVKGLGEGRYYLLLNGYVNQIEKKLGFKPYPGTLNLKLKTIDDIVKKAELLKTPGIIIEGFSNGLRTYGRVKAFKAKINNIENVAVILPERTSHGLDILEIIAPFNIRKKLNLKNGDEITVTVYLQ